MMYVCKYVQRNKVQEQNNVRDIHVYSLIVRFASMVTCFYMAE